MSEANRSGVGTPELDEIAAAWHVDRDALAAALAERGLTAISPHARDVALACALAAGDPGALAVFERDIVPDLRGALARLDRSGDLVDEALQQMRAKLLVAVGPPRILEYRGRGSLAAWVQVIAIREALMIRRKARRDRPTEDPLIVIAERDPALALTRHAHGAAFAVAFQAAIAMLSPRDRALLRLCFVDGVGTEQLAAQYAVHRVTMFRWLTDARARLLEALRGRLIVTAGVAADEVDSLIRAVASSFDVGW